MNTKAKIIIAIQALAIVFLLMLSNVKATEAEKLAIEAQEQFKRAEITEQNAQKIAKVAEQKAVESIESLDRALRAEKKLEGCQNSK